VWEGAPAVEPCSPDPHSAAPEAGNVPVPPAWALHPQPPPLGSAAGANQGLCPSAHGGVLQERDTNSDAGLMRRWPLAAEDDEKAGGAVAHTMSTEDPMYGGSLSSPSPSTVDLHGPASLGQASSVPSLLSNNGALELSDSPSNPSLTISTNSSAKEAAPRYAVPSPVPPLPAMAPPAELAWGAWAPTASEPARRTPELPCRDVWRCQTSEVLADEAETERLSAGAKRETVGDENAPPDDTLPTPRTATLQDGRQRSDPLAQTVKSGTLSSGITVTTMRSFWETKARSGSREARDSLGASGTPRSGRSGSALGGGSPRGAAEKGGDSCRSHSASQPRRQGGTSARLRRDLAEQQKLMDDSNALLSQLTLRIRGNSQAVAEDSRRSSGSESEAPTEAERETEGNEGASVLRGFVRTFRQSTSSLWKTHRQTVRLVLEHLDGLYPSPQAGGAGHGGALAVAAAQAEEPAGEPDAGS